MTKPNNLDAHRWLSRTLSPFFSDEDVQAPDDALWPEIIKLSDSWMVTARLENRVKRCDFVPPDAREVLTIVSEFTQNRANTMRSELCEIVAILNAAGIRPVVFKGAEWLLGHYCPNACRIMSDIDIWIPDSLGQISGLNVLQEYGYLPTSPLEHYDKKFGHHFPPLRRDGAMACLELHHQLISPESTDVVALVKAEKKLVSTKKDGLSYFRLSTMDSITMAYLQSGHLATPSFDSRRVTISKWLDFLDRLNKFGPSDIKSASDIGILTDDNEIDRQLLTVLQEFFGLPYSGPKDTAYIETWTSSPSSFKLLVRQLYKGARWKNLCSLNRWRHLILGFKTRLKHNNSISKL